MPDVTLLGHTGTSTYTTHSWGTLLLSVWTKSNIRPWNSSLWYPAYIISGRIPCSPPNLHTHARAHAHIYTKLIHSDNAQNKEGSAQLTICCDDHSVVYSVTPNNSLIWRFSSCLLSVWLQSPGCSDSQHAWYAKVSVQIVYVCARLGDGHVQKCKVSATPASWYQTKNRGHISDLQGCNSVAPGHGSFSPVATFKLCS